jgi:hypothetical protein
MLPAATVRALTIPAFTAAEFTPTQWARAEDKAKFANALMKFIANEFPRRDLGPSSNPGPPQSNAAMPALK